MGYSKEFPDYRGLGIIPAGLGFPVDTSWHNDACPSFETEDGRYRLWVDYPNPKDKEDPSLPRFGIQKQDENGDPLDYVFGAESLEDLKSFLESEAWMRR